MKKKKRFLVLILIICICFLSGCTFNKFETKEVSEIKKTIQEIPDKQLYNTLEYDNPFKTPILISFEDLSKFDEQYANWDALGWKQNKHFYIFINQKHKDAPIEALTALTSGRLVHTDTYDSKNEEIFAWMIEAYVWEFLLRQNPELAEIKHPLVKRENSINKLFKKGDFSEFYIRHYIQTSEAYAPFPQSSPGFTDDELNQKLENLKNIYHFN